MIDQAGLASDYQRDGFISHVPILNAEETAELRNQLRIFIEEYCQDRNQRFIREQAPDAALSPAALAEYKRTEDIAAARYANAENKGVIA